MRGFLEENLNELELNYECLITKTAFDLKLRGIIWLDQILKGSDHIGL